MSAYSTTTANLPQMPSAEQWPKVLDENRRALGDRYANALEAVYNAVKAGDVEAYGVSELARTELRDSIFREAADVRRGQLAGEPAKLAENSLQRGSEQWNADHGIAQPSPETPQPAHVDAERPQIEDIDADAPEVAEPGPKRRFDLTKAGLAGAAMDIGRRAWRPIKPHTQISRDGLIDATRDIARGAKIAGAAALVGVEKSYDAVTSDWVWRPERKHYDLSRSGVKEAGKRTLMAAHKAGKVAYKAGKWTTLAIADNITAANERYAAKLAAEAAPSHAAPTLDDLHEVPVQDTPSQEQGRPDISSHEEPSADVPAPATEAPALDADVPGRSKSHDVRTNLDSGWNRL